MPGGSRRRFIAWSVCVPLVALPVQAARNDWTDWFEGSAVVPFVFSTQTLGATIGMAGLVKGVLQPNAGLVAAGLVSAKGSGISYLNYNNFQFGGSWLLGFDLYSGQYAGYDYFIGDASRNDSRFEQSVKTDGEEERYHLTLRYILPWGAAEGRGARGAMTPKRTITGSSPVSSGISTLTFEPFYHGRKLEVAEASSIPEAAWGVKLGFEWDNRNDVRNPSEGSKFNLDITHSPPHRGNSDWTMIELEQSYYLDLGAWDGVFKEQVLALDMYTADTPSWSECGGEPCHRPPEYAGVSLGGLYRLRGYSSERYHGRSAIHYSAEYRVMPEWQPLGSWPVFNWYDVPWWQWVVFVDAGRVADQYNLSTLHTDMQWNLGGGVRFQVEGIVVRAEMAVGKEEGLFWVMVNQPF